MMIYFLTVIFLIFNNVYSEIDLCSKLPVNPCAPFRCVSKEVDSVPFFFCDCGNGVIEINKGCTNSSFEFKCTLACENNGKCEKSENGSPKCLCPPNFTGNLCEFSISTNPCKTSQVCGKDRCEWIPEKLSYLCICEDGRININSDCNVEPKCLRECKNGGTCAISNGKSYCMCPINFIGDLCQYEVSVIKDPCEANPCKNGAQCVANDSKDPESLNFFCSCTAGFSGFFCDKKDFDYNCRDLCQNGGSCNEENNMCICPNGFGGILCENIIDQSCKCKNGGKCFPNSKDTICICPLGFEGVLCELPIDRSCNNYCKNGGTCIHKGKDAICVCTLEYYGEFCEKKIDSGCANLCKNGGKCSEDHFCICPDGYVGNYCDTKIDLCASFTCMNDGLCMPIFESFDFVCLCTKDFTGRYCETPLNVTGSYSIIKCGNNGTCKTNGIVNTTGYCEKEKPCKNASCIDIPNWLNSSIEAKYFCLCNNGSIGYPTCSYQLNQTNASIIQKTERRMPADKNRKPLKHNDDDDDEEDDSKRNKNNSDENDSFSEEIFISYRRRRHIHKKPSNHGGDNNCNHTVIKPDIQNTSYCEMLKPCQIENASSACIDLPYKFKKSIETPYLCLCGNNNTFGYPYCDREIKDLIKPTKSEESTSSEELADCDLDLANKENNGNEDSSNKDKFEKKFETLFKKQFGKLIENLLKN